jgi:hypothetical protein
VSATEINTRMRIADPKPPYCTTCFQAATPELQFVDCNAAYEGQTVVHPETGVLITIMEDIYICMDCIKQAIEAAGFKPELHARQIREIRRLELIARNWEDRCKGLERMLAKGHPEPIR